jgi:hypothetical protein
VTSPSVSRAAQRSATPVATPDRCGLTVPGCCRMRSFAVGERDALVLRLDRNGNVVWAKAIGGTESDWTGSIRRTADGGFITAGGTESFGVGGEG